MASSWEHPGLSARQRTRLEQLYPGAHTVADHSWPFGITVLEFVHAGRRLLLKASGSPHHLERESRAHRCWLDQLSARVPQLLGYDADAGLLVKTFVAGELALGTPREYDPRVFEQAGGFLGSLHRGTAAVMDPHYERSMLSKTRAWLERAPGLAPSEQLLRARTWLEGFVPSTVELVPTHGDYQPRNWIVGPGGEVAVIDFGRAELRPWYTDLVRLEHRYFAPGPELRDAFLRGYAPHSSARLDDAGEPGRRLDDLMQSLGTIVWAHDVGDPGFEEEGRTMLTRALGPNEGAPRGHR